MRPVARRTRSHGRIRHVEVLVVLIVVAIAAVVALRMTYSSRVRAQQAQCSNNLRQLGLACHSYEDVWGRLPWNWDSAWGGHPSGQEPDPYAYPDRPFSWIVAVLPFFEAQAVYDKIDFEVDQGNAGNNGASMRDQPRGKVNNNLFTRELVLKSLLCPANMQPSVPEGQNRGYADGGGSGPPAARTDYTGNMGHVWGGWRDCATIPDFPHATKVFIRGQQGTPWVDGDWDSHMPRCQGLFYYRGSAKLDDCLDGTANTLMLIEDYHWRGGNDRRARLDMGNTPDSAWMSPLAAISNLRQPMNTRNKAWLGQAGDVRCHGWSSNHPRGAHGCLGNASVKFFSQDMDHYVRYALATKDGGEGLEVKGGRNPP